MVCGSRKGDGAPFLYGLEGFVFGCGWCGKNG